MYFRFEKLNLECLHLNERYLEALQMFQDEIEELRDRYNEERQNPLLPRNIPPVSARIMWIRQLYSRIEEPMNIFKENIRVRPKFQFIDDRGGRKFCVFCTLQSTVILVFLTNFRL